MYKNLKRQNTGKNGISLIALIITIIVIIILAAIVIGTTLTAPESANRAKFTADLSEVQHAVSTKLASNYNQYITNPDSIDLNAGFTRVSVYGAPETFNSFALQGAETGTIGYLVKLDTIKMEQLTIGQEYKTATDITFDGTDAFVYDSEGEVFYALGHKYQDKIYYSVADLEAGREIDGVKNIGTEIEIYTKEQLANIGKGLVVYDENVVYNGDVVAAKGKWNYADTYTYKIMADIDLSSIANWEPIPEFKGKILGNNHTISNLKVDKSTTNNIGLISTVNGSGEITDLKLTNVNVKGATYTGGLVGLFYSTGRIKNCSVTGTVQGMSGYYVGGLAGSFSTGILEDCYSQTTVSGVDTVGGLIGRVYTGIVRRSYSNSSVSASYQVGGFVGRTDNNATSMEISECYSEGSATATVNNAGGFVGLMYSGATADSENHIITNCYTKATSTASSGSGGFIGCMEYGSISNCYAIGKAQAENTAGGFAGILTTVRTDSKIKIEKCYSLGNAISTKKDAYTNSNIGGFIGTIGFFQSNASNYKINYNYSLGNATSNDNGNCVGGFIGLIHVAPGMTGKLEFINNYSIGKPTTTGAKGGFISSLSATGTKTITYTNNFWDRTTSEITATSGTAAYKTTTEMKTPATFSTWSTGIWNIVSNEYPTLKWDFTNVWNQVAGGGHTLKWQ